MPTLKEVRYRLTAAAPAKINLFLHVTGQRADGYHLLDSIFLFADLADRLEAEPADDLTLEMAGPWSVPVSALEERDNSVLEAATALREAYEVDTGVRLKLEKRIPVAAGLGGGSADAAATLRLLDEFWELEAGDRRLAEIGVGLGADVPACLVGLPARIGGIGEMVEPLREAPPWAVLLVNPRVFMPTATVFGALRDSGTPFSAPVADLSHWRDATWLARHTKNDLQAPAIALEPAIGEAIDRLAALPGCRLARMSGSGATCFALFDSLEAASAGAERLAGEQPNWWHWAGRLLR